MPKTSDPDVLLLNAAADPTRLRMLTQLALTGPVCACDFADGNTVSQPTISHHLRVLRQAGWVSTERRGTWIWYSLRPEAAHRFARLAAMLAPVTDETAPVRWRRLGVVDVENL
jgi:DNA-binding transcriptional ArsR family regulator